MNAAHRTRDRGGGGPAHAAAGRPGRRRGREQHPYARSHATHPSHAQEHVTLARRVPDLHLDHHASGGHHHRLQAQPVVRGVVAEKCEW